MPMASLLGMHKGVSGRCWCVRAGVLEGIFSVGMLFLGWRTLASARQALQKATTKHIKA